MERPQKRQRLGLSPHEESDDDELNYEPEEISLRRDPGTRLAQSRATAAFGLKSAFESIFAKYERDFEGVADEIDLRTADIVVDNRHLQRMRTERDMGDNDDEDFRLHDNGVVAGERGHPGDQLALRGDGVEDQILRGRSNALVRRGPGTLAPHMPSVSGQRLGIMSHLGAPRQPPPLGASPLFFGSWGAPSAMDPAWQAPQLPAPQFKSSFAADLFTGRYQLPAREASKSIWAPGSHSDDDEEDTPVEKPRMRLAPPTRRVPARPKAMKLIRAPPTNSEDSSDEDFILMGVNVSQVPNDDSDPSFHPQALSVGFDEADLLIDRLERELEGENETELERGTMDPAVIGPTITPPFAATDKTVAVAGGVDPRKEKSTQPTDILPPTLPNERKRSKIKTPKQKHISTAKKNLTLGVESPTSVDIAAPQPGLLSNDIAHPVISRQRERVVVELPPSSSIDDGSYLDFSDMADLPLETSLPAPIPDAQASTIPEYQPDQSIEGSAGNQMSSNHTIPDSQEPPLSLPMSSASNVPPEQPEESTRREVQMKNEKMPNSLTVYDLSDEEIGFLSRPPRKRKRVSDITSPSAIRAQLPTGPTVARHSEPRTRDRQYAEVRLPSANPLITVVDSPKKMFSSLKTRSARSKANHSRPYPLRCPSPKDPARCASKKRKLTPPSLSSADSTENGSTTAQVHPNPALSVALVSPPPECEASGDVAAVEERNIVHTATSKSMVDAEDIPDKELPLHGKRSSHEPSTPAATRRTSRRGSNSVPMTELVLPSVQEGGQSRGTTTAPLGSHRSPKLGIVPAAETTPTSTPSSTETHSTWVPRGAANYSTRRNRACGRTREGAGSSPPAAEHSAFSYQESGPTALSPPLTHQLPDASYDAPSSTPRLDPHASLCQANLPDSRPKPATPSRTTKLGLSVPSTPPSVPSTGHRSFTSLIPEESLDNDSEDELTSSSLFHLFQKFTPGPASSAKSPQRKRAPERTPTKFKGRVSAIRISSSFSVERPSTSNESVMRTPGGTIRKCGERGLKCGKDFCFTCC